MKNDLDIIEDAASQIARTTGITENSALDLLCEIGKLFDLDGLSGQADLSLGYSRCRECGQFYHFRATNQKDDYEILILCPACFDMAGSSGLEHFPSRHIYSSRARYEDWLGRERNYLPHKQY